MIVLSAGGHWISGTECTIQVHAEPDSLAKPMVLRWVIHKNETVIKTGDVKLDKETPDATIRLVLPEVRAETQVELVIKRLPGEGEADKEELIRKEITLYPPRKKTNFAKLLGRRKLVVLESDEKYSASLKELKLRHLRLNRLSSLTLQNPDVMIVATNALTDEKNFDVLLDHAQAGALVVIFGHHGIDGFLDHGLPNGEVVEISQPESLQWNRSHPLATSMTYISRWPDSEKIYALRLQGDATESAVAWAAQENKIDTGKADAKDCFLASFPVGKGRVVVCMADFERPGEDVRFQELLNSILDSK